MTRTLATLTLAVALTATAARAQDVPISSPTMASASPVVRPFPGPSPYGMAPSPSYTPPYSYYAATTGPARVYVPLNADDHFPFHGQPYGHAYDRWTWGYIQGANPYLQKYFYPPVR